MFIVQFTVSFEINDAKSEKDAKIKAYYFFHSVCTSMFLKNAIES